MKVIVVCPDHTIKHPAFETEADAEMWIEYGHFCLSARHHMIMTISDDEIELIRRLMLWMTVVDIILPKELTRHG